MSKRLTGASHTAVGLLIAILIVVIAPATSHAAPTISGQPTSQTGRVTGSVTLSVTATAPDPITYQWYKGGTALVDTPDFNIDGSVIGDVTGATSQTLALSNLTAAAYGSDYYVRVTSGGVSADSISVSISNLPAPSQAGPLNVFAGIGAAQINYSAYVESGVGTANRGAPESVTVSYGGVPREARFFHLPGQSGSALWLLFPESSVGDRDGCAVGETKISANWAGGVTASFCVASELSVGASMTVEQVSNGSLQIRATMISPKFEGIVEPLVASPYSVNFQVYDDATGQRIEPPCPSPETGNCPGRPGWSASLSGSSMLQTVDPLVLPEGSLGKRIRVGALIYYYPRGYGELESTTGFRYAALSDPITMQTSGGGSGGGGGAPDPEPTTTPSTPPVVPAPIETAPPVVQPVVAPQIADPSAVTAQQIEAFTPAQVSLIPPREFGQLPPQAIAALTPEQVEALTPTQVSAIRPARAAAITPTAAAAMNPEQLEALRPASVRALPPESLAALSGEQLAALRPRAIARITPSALQALSPAQLRGLTVEQRSQLTRRQLRALSPLQRAALRRSTRSTEVKGGTLT